MRQYVKPSLVQKHEFAFQAKLMEIAPLKVESELIQSVTESNRDGSSFSPR